MLRAFASGRLFGESYGSGVPAVLALHGWARTHADFAAVLGTVPALDAIAPDLPGFGATPAPPSAWGSPEYADAVAPVLEEMAEEVIVIGHSFGGRIAVHLAASRPDRVRALVLTGVPLFRPEGAARRPAARYRAVRRLARLGLVGDRRLEAARQRYGSADYRAASGVVRDVLVTMLGERYDEPLAALRCPVSLVWGAADHDVPVSVGRRTHALVPGSTLIELPGVGHLTPTEAPEALRRALGALL